MNKFQVLNMLQTQAIRYKDDWQVWYQGIYLGIIITHNKRYLCIGLTKYERSLHSSYMSALASFVDKAIIKHNLCQKEREAVSVNCVHQFITRGKRKTFLEKVKGWFK